MTLYTYPLIDIQGPTGPTGATGAQGFVGSVGAGYTGSASMVTGPTGATGAPGSSGFVGYQGSQGDVGYTGSQGFTGSAGVDGVVGYRGSQGLSGYTGSRGNLGYTGSSGTTGFAGSEGARGFAGYTGSRGSVGYTGSAGADGFAGSVGLRGFTGYTGSRGDLGFTGSRGEGDVGYTGSVGVGSTGYTGSRGAVGFTGSQGPSGDIGAVGYVGSRGDLGFTGSQGSVGVGYAGSKGLDAAGYTGSQGFTGSAGTSGTAGFTGSSGVDAAGYTGSRGAVGFTGSRGEVGVGYTGSTGTQGAIGFTGSKGEDAAVGYRGSQGDPGEPGYTGSRGAVGFTGSIGFTGSQGYTGSRGDTGFTGSIGYTGSQGAGFTGSMGYTGSRGYTGSVGYTGSEGVRGQRGELGYTGSLGIGEIGYTGSRGVIGYTGSQGVPGTGGISAIPSSTAVTPGFPLAVDANTGLFGNTDDQIGISTGGVARALITNTQTQVTNELTGVTALFTSGASAVSINQNVGSGTTTGVVINSDGNLEIIRSAGGAYIDFKTSATEDFDVRLTQNLTAQELIVTGPISLVDASFKVVVGPSQEVGFKKITTVGSYVGTFTSNNLELGTNNTQRLHITHNPGNPAENFVAVVSGNLDSRTGGGAAQIRDAGNFSATVPIYTFYNNAESGIGNPTSGVISLITSGTETARMSTQGRFGINTTNPLDRLHVNGYARISSETGQECRLVFAVANSANTPYLVLGTGLFSPGADLGHWGLWDPALGPTVLGAPGQFRFSTDPNGNFTVGNTGLIREPQIHLVNSTRDLYLYLQSSGGEFGLYDAGANNYRWRTYDNGDFQARGNVTTITPTASNHAATKAYVDALPFTKQYTSAPVAALHSAVINLTHGLGVVPKLVSIDLICVTADGGYSPGQIIHLGAPSSEGEFNDGVTILKTSTQLTLYLGNAGFSDLIRTDGSGQGFGPVSGRWNFIVNAWA